MPKKISFFSLMILIIAAIDNLRNLPSAALFGSALIFFFTLSALLFLIPTSLISAELSAAFPEKGGICHWVSLAFGKRSAMAAIWLQWINTMVWYPSMLLFIAGALSYLIDPALVENKAYLIGSVLVIFWGLTFLNLKGLQVSTVINNIFCILGTMLPLIVLMSLGGAWVMSGKPLQITVTMDQLLPSMGDSASWTSLIAIMASFLGMELSGVHVNDILNPQKNFPRAVLLACIFIFTTLLFGSLSIAFVLPAEEINLISGVIQVYKSFFEAFGLEALTPVITLLIVIGSTGTMINWLISPAKGLLNAAEFGFLPPFFSKLNKHGVASNILFSQAVLVTVICLLILFNSSVNGSYWFFTALSTELYMGMYVLMFAAAIKLHYSHPERKEGFKIPGGAIGIWLTGLSGLVGAVATIIVTFLSPENIELGGSFHYFVMICIGNVLTISPLLFFFYYEKKTRAALPVLS